MGITLREVKVAAVHIVVGVLAGVALDWALFGRWKMLLGAFGDEWEIRYRDLPSVRLVLIIIASAAIGFSAASGGPMPFPFWTGLAVFLLSNFYALSIVLRR